MSNVASTSPCLLRYRCPHLPLQKVVTNIEFKMTEFYTKPSDLASTEMPSERICDGKTQILWP